MIKELSLSSLPIKYCRTETKNLRRIMYSPTVYVALCDGKYVRIEECLHGVSNLEDEVLKK
jgi:hypothetical protein